MNEVGFEDANDQMCDGRDLPWLQELAGDGVWEDWGVVYRDLIVIDGSGTWLFTANLTGYDLGDDENLDALRGQLLEVIP